MSPRIPTCLICAAPLSFHQAQTDKLCGNANCRWQRSILMPHQVCGVCGRMLAARQLSARVCTDLECQQTHNEREAWARQEQERRAHQALREQALALRDQHAEAADIKEPALFPLTLVPSFAAPVVNVAERRRRALRDHLTALISKATEHRGTSTKGAAASVPAAAPSATQAVTGRVCAQCKGDCCRNGREHAYLTVDTIRRYLDAHPDQRPRDVLAAYLARVGNKSYEGSCIYHGTNGCTLPAEMRSDVCNDHFCAGLKEFLREVANGREPRGFFVSTRDDVIQAAAFLG